MEQLDNVFILSRFLEGASRTANLLEGEWRVSDRKVEGSDIGGCGLIMRQLIHIIEEFKAGRGAKYDNPIPLN